MFAYTFEDVLKQAAQRKWAIFPLDFKKAAVIPSKSLRTLIEGMEAPEVLTNRCLEVRSGWRWFKLKPRVRADELQKLLMELVETLRSDRCPDSIPVKISEV